MIGLCGRRTHRSRILTNPKRLSERSTMEFEAGEQYGGVKHGAKTSRRTVTFEGYKRGGQH
jgi:hypothetical protein